jgi:hypothetical protein
VKLERLLVLTLVFGLTLSCSRDRSSTGRTISAAIVFAVSSASPIDTDIYTVSASDSGFQLHRSLTNNSDFVQLTVPGTRDIISVKVDPFDTNSIYVSGINGDEDFAFLSIDRGEQFSRLSTGLPAAIDSSRRAAFLVPDPQVQSRLWLGFTQTSGSANPPIFRSDDRGQNWASASSGFPNSSVTKITFDATDSNLVLVSTEAGVVRSVDAGQSWQTDNTGLPASSLVTDLVSDPSMTTRFYAVADFRLFLRDGANDWTELSAAGSLGAQVNPGSSSFAARPSTVRVDPNNPQKLFLGVRGFGLFVSEDGGASFDHRPMGFRDFNDFSVSTQEILIDPGDSQKVFVATEAGPYISTDGGQSFTLKDETGLFRFSKTIR